MARIILDHGAPHQLRRALTDRQVDSAFYHGWAQFRNGELIAAGFEIIITCDQRIKYQQNLSGRKLAVVELTTNRWALIKQHVERISAAISLAQPDSYQIVEIG